MQRILLLSLILLAVSMAGFVLVPCIVAKPKEPEVADRKPAPPVRKWRAPYDWHHDPPPTKPVEESKFVYDRPALKKVVSRWQAAAETVAGEAFHLRWHGARNTAVTWWSPTPQHVSSSGYIDGGALSKEGEVHLIRLSLVSNTDIYRPEFIKLNATWKPAGKGWSAHLYTSSKGDTSGQTLISFTPCGEMGTEQYFDFFPGVTRGQYQATFDEVRHTFWVSLPEVDMGGVSAPLNHGKLIEWMASREAFRAAGLQMLDRLDKTVQEKFNDEGAELFATIKVTEGGTASDDPPRTFEEPVMRSLKPNESEQLLKIATADIALRRDFFSQHADGRYEALKKVFPLEQLAE